MEDQRDLSPSPLVGEGGARAAQRRGRVRGNAAGLTKRQLLPPDTVTRSRALRKGAGELERRLWQALRSILPTAKFRRQVPFGIYHADFCSHAARLIVEVDGDDHAIRLATDAIRTRFLQNEGYHVIRFANSDVMQNLEGVVAAIECGIRTRKGRP